MSETFVAEVIQYMMPNGRQVARRTELPARVHAAYLDMQKHGYHFEAEMLMTGEISITIANRSDEEDSDIDGELVTNGPDVQKAMVVILERARWKETP